MVKPTEKGKLNLGESKYIRKTYLMLETMESMFHYHDIGDYEEIRKATLKIRDTMDKYHEGNFMWRIPKNKVTQYGGSETVANWEKIFGEY